MTTALITGANKGLGYETARRLSALGWTVLLGARDRTLGRSAVEALAARPDTRGDVHLVSLDVTSDESVEAAAAQVSELGVPLDVLINNAGVIGPRKDIMDTTPQDFIACYGVNLLGPVRMTRAMAPLMMGSDNPRVVMVSSGLGSLAVTSDPQRLESRILSLVYPSSKAALNMVTTQYAKALPAFRINAVDPGYTPTDLNDHSGHQSVEEGVTAIVELARVAPDGPTGGFFSRQGPVPW